MPDSNYFVLIRRRRNDQITLILGPVTRNRSEYVAQAAAINLDHRNYYIEIHAQSRLPKEALAEITTHEPHLLHTP